MYINLYNFLAKLFNYNLLKFKNIFISIIMDILNYLGPKTLLKVH